MKYSDEQIEIFRIVQEGLANARKHAGARRAWVTIEQRGSRRLVTVRDDGVGFEGGETEAGQGLRNMKLRAESIEGGFSLVPAPAAVLRSRSSFAPSDRRHLTPLDRVIGLP